MKKKQAHKQTGFTLIELIMVIVVLGILAAIAIPKFINLKDDAQNASTRGIAGSLSSASAINYGARSMNNVAAPVGTMPITNCDQVAFIMEGGTVPAGGAAGVSGLPRDSTGALLYTITSAAVAAGTTVQCDLVGPNLSNGNPSTAKFTAIGIS